MKGRKALNIITASVLCTCCVSIVKAEDTGTVQGLRDQLAAIHENVYPGTAGSSLTSAYAGADLMTWYKQNSPDTGAITQEITAYAADMNKEEKDVFTEQLAIVSAGIGTTISEGGSETLDCAGWNGEVTWNETDAESVIQALELK